MRWDSWELGIADSNATFSSGSVQGLPVDAFHRCPRSTRTRRRHRCRATRHCVGLRLPLAHLPGGGRKKRSKRAMKSGRV